MRPRTAEMRPDGDRVGTSELRPIFAYNSGEYPRDRAGGLEVEATALAVVLTTHRTGAEETEIVDDPKPCR